MIDDDEVIEARRKLRHERFMKRQAAEAAARINDRIPVPHVGLAAYARDPAWRDPVRAARLAGLLVDERWPWLPWWASYVAKDRRDDRSSVRVGGKNGAQPLLEGLASDKLRTLHMNRAMGRGNFTTVLVDLEQIDPYPYEVLVTCKSVELPRGKTFEAWLSLAHDLVATVGAAHATIGAWPTYEMARQDTWKTRVILDTPTGDIDLGLPTDFRTQISKLSECLADVGRTYARHPRWGTYLHAGHVTAIGGVERIRTEVGPARIDPVGELTYIQLTDSIETALTAEAGAKRRALEALMAPILLGASLPPPTPSP